MSNTMRAIRMSGSVNGSPATLSVESVPRPKPAVNQILVQVKASNIAPSDIINSKAGFPHTTFPRTPGRDFAGIVVDGAPAMMGQAVFGTSGFMLSFTQDGAHAEFVVVPADGVAIKPAGLSFVQAAVLGVPWTTAQLALMRTTMTATDTVLVLGGTGSVGSAAVQIAKAKGCRVLVGARGDKGDVDTQDPKLTAARSLTGGNGPQVIIDTVGDEALFRGGLDVLGHGGRYGFISSGKVPDGLLTVNLKKLYRNEQSLVGCNSVAHSQAEMARSLAALAKLIERGSLVPPAEESLEKITLDEALDVYSGKRKGKCVITF